MKRIIFVDDEPKVLEGMERQLFQYADQWDMVFVNSGEDALAEMAKTTFDVIVSDLRMPKMSGQVLLQHVQDRFPYVVRIALSGHSELEVAMKSMPLVHQFLVKPCSPKVIQSTLERAVNLHSLISDVQVQKFIGNITKLPTRPTVYVKVTKVLSQEEFSFDELAEIVEQDMGLSAKLLQIVNSGYFAPSKRVQSIRDAVTRLGSQVIRDLALTIEVFQQYQESKIPSFSIDALQKHVMLVGQIASKIQPDKKLSDDCRLAGMLHDIGKLVLASQQPDYVIQAMATAKKGRKSFHQAEQELSGLTHAEVGGYLMGLWGLPYPIVEVVANHHAPQRVPHPDFDVLSSVYIANHLAKAYQGENTLIGEKQDVGIDMQFLQQLGVADKLESFRVIAAKTYEQGGTG